MRYEGYDESEDRWLGEDDLANAQDILREYKREKELEEQPP